MKSLNERLVDIKSNLDEAVKKHREPKRRDCVSFIAYPQFCTGLWCRDDELEMKFTAWLTFVSDNGFNLGHWRSFGDMGRMSCEPIQVRLTLEEWEEDGICEKAVLAMYNLEKWRSNGERGHIPDTIDSLALLYDFI